MKTMKTCKYGCGKMAAGGVTKTTKVKKVKKMAMGGSATKPFAAGIPYATGSGQTDGKNGMMKKGGMVKNAKLAALAAPKDKITRADVITGAKMKMRKKK
jgi:hypothetical protein